MAEQNSVITTYRRRKLAQITSGAITSISEITHIAFGDGGVDSEGKVLVPSATQTVLKNEFCRYLVDSVAYPVETTVRYTVTIPKGQQTGKAFSEMGLIDKEGELCAVKNMLVKIKDDDVMFSFEFDDEF